MQATLGFLQHYATDAASLRAMFATPFATLGAQLRTKSHASYTALREALSSRGDDFASLDAHLRRDIGLGEFGAADVATLRPDAVRA